MLSIIRGAACAAAATFLHLCALTVMTAPALAQSGSHQTGPMHSAAGPATYKVGGLTITAPWARATPRGAPVAGGYLTITNNGTGSDRLVGGSFAVADRFEVHEMTMEGGVMRMRPVAGGLEIKPGQTVELKPGGYHVMFMGLKGELKAGDTIRGTLEFARAGKIEISYPVRAMGGGSGHRSH